MVLIVCALGRRFVLIQSQNVYWSVSKKNSLMCSARSCFNICCLVVCQISYKKVSLYDEEVCVLDIGRYLPVLVDLTSARTWDNNASVQ